MAYRSRTQHIADYFVMVGLQSTDCPIQERECNETLGNTVIPRPSEPITDITIISKSVGENVPPGISLVHNIRIVNANITHYSSCHCS